MKAFNAPKMSSEIIEDTVVSPRWTSQIFIFSSVVTIFVLLKYYITMQKNYEMISKIPGPGGIPILGNLYVFLGHLDSEYIPFKATSDEPSRYSLGVFFQELLTEFWRCWTSTRERLNFGAVAN